MTDFACYFNAVMFIFRSTGTGSERLQTWWATVLVQESFTICRRTSYRPCRQKTPKMIHQKWCRRARVIEKVQTGPRKAPMKLQCKIGEKQNICTFPKPNTSCLAVKIYIAVNSVWTDTWSILWQLRISQICCRSIIIKNTDNVDERFISILTCLTANLNIKENLITSRC